MKERGGPGMFPHVRDAKGRKVAEKAYLSAANWGSEQQGMR